MSGNSDHLLMIIVVEKTVIMGMQKKVYIRNFQKLLAFFILKVNLIKPTSFIKYTETQSCLKLKKINSSGGLSNTF